MARVLRLAQVIGLALIGVFLVTEDTRWLIAAAVVIAPCLLYAVGRLAMSASKNPDDYGR